MKLFQGPYSLSLDFIGKRFLEVGNELLKWAHDLCCCESQVTQMDDI